MILRLQPLRTLALASAATLVVFGGAAAAATTARTVYTSYSVETGDTAEAVTLQGSVAEIFGHFFILEGPAGRALVDLGPEGENGALVRTNETLTVEGKAFHGVVHACRLTLAEGRMVKLEGPPAPPAPPVPPMPPAPPGIAGQPVPPAPPAPPAPPPPPKPPFACD